MLSPLPEIRDGEKGLLFAASSSSSLAQQQVIYSACLPCLCLCCALAVRLEVGVWEGL